MRIRSGGWPESPLHLTPHQARKRSSPRSIRHDGGWRAGASERARKGSDVPRNPVLVDTVTQTYVQDAGRKYLGADLYRTWRQACPLWRTSDPKMFLVKSKDCSHAPVV